MDVAAEELGDKEHAGALGGFGVDVLKAVTVHLEGALFGIVAQFPFQGQLARDDRQGDGGVAAIIEGDVGDFLHTVIYLDGVALPAVAVAVVEVEGDFAAVGVSHPCGGGVVAAGRVGHCHGIVSGDFRGDGDRLRGAVVAPLVAHTLGGGEGDAAVGVGHHGIAGDGNFGVGIAEVGFEVEDGALVGVEHVAAGVEVGDGEIAIVGARPAPVEMEVVVLVVAIAYEGVAAVVAGTAVINRSVGVELGFQRVHPRSFAALVLEGAAGIAEVFVHGFRHVFAIGAAGTRTVHHVDAYTAVIQQFGHFSYLVAGTAAVEVVGHQVVVVGGFAEIGIQGAIISVPVLAVVGHVGVAAVTLGGPLPVAHDLSHGGSHTAGDGSVVARSGTELVVVRALVPCGGQQGSDDHLAARGGRFVGEQLLPRLLHGGVGTGAGTGGNVAHRIAVAVEPCGHVGGDVLRVEMSCGAVAEHGQHAVVRRHHHKAAALAVEDIHAGILCGIVNLIGHLKRIGGTGNPVLRQKMGRRNASCQRVHRTGIQQESGDKEKQEKG